MIDHDRLFKELISTFFLEFLELFVPEIRSDLDEASLVFLDKELFTDVTSGEHHEADLIVRVKFRHQDAFFLVHVETQAQPQSDFGRRMFRYFARLHEKYHLPVYPIVVFTYDRPRRRQPQIYQVAFANRVVMKFRYDVVQLNRLSWRNYLKQPNPVASALMAKMKMSPRERPRVKLECLRLMTTLKLDRARLRLISGFVDTYLRLTDEEELVFRQELAVIEPKEQETIMELTTSWEEKGLQRGLQQGLEQGKQQEAVAMILRLLTHRFGPVGPDTEQRIISLSLARLEELGEALLDFTEPGDVLHWLHVHQNSDEAESV